MDFGIVPTVFRMLQRNFRCLPLIEGQISKTPLPSTLACIHVRSQEYTRYHLLKYHKVTDGAVGEITNMIRYSMVQK